MSDFVKSSTEFEGLYFVHIFHKVMFHLFFKNPQESADEDEEKEPGDSGESP